MITQAQLLYIFSQEETVLVLVVTHAGKRVTSPENVPREVGEVTEPVTIVGRKGIFHGNAPQVGVRAAAVVEAVPVTTVGKKAICLVNVLQVAAEEEVLVAVEAVVEEEEVVEEDTRQTTSLVSSYLEPYT